VPVNYICARDLAMMQAFLAAALLGWVHMRRHGSSPWGWLLVLAAATAALLSKTNPVVLPGVILAYEVTLGGGRLSSPRSWRPVLPFVVLIVGFFVYTTTALGFSDAAQLGLGRSGLGPYVEYGATQLAMHVTHYLRNVVWPLPMRPLPAIAAVSGPADVRLWIGALVVGGTLVAAWRWRRRRPVLAFSILAYWLMFAPTSSVLPFRRLAADYRGYPSLPWLMLAVCLAAHPWMRPVLRRGLTAVAVVAFALLSAHQADVWQDEESLWEQSVRYGGEPIAHVNYARSLMGRDDDLARQHLLLALNEQPNNVFAMVNLGLIEIRAGEVDTGVDRVGRAAASVPDWADIQVWYSRALVEAGRPGPAADAALRAARLDPAFESEAVARLYAAALAAQADGDFAGSLACVRQLHELQPSYQESLFLEGYALQQLGERDAAIAVYRRSLAADPDQAQVHFNLGYALMEAGRHADAVQRFERALELRPEWASAHGHLARCLEALGRRDEAADHRARFEALR
jgi:tetratricopeptide (TPR) repeat protein